MMNNYAQVIARVTLRCALATVAQAPLCLLLFSACGASAQNPILPPPPNYLLDQNLASSDGRVIFEHFVIKGNSVLQEALLAEIVKPYLGRSLAPQDLSQLRDQLTMAYVSRGYINSGALIKNNKPGDKTLNIEIIEGRIEHVYIQTNGRLKNRYIKQRLAIDSQQALNVNHLEKQLQILRQNARVDTLQANLSPGESLGRSVLEVKVAEKRAYQWQLGLSNYESPSIGSQLLRLGFEHNNISGEGDEARLGLRKTEGLEAYDASYQRPLNARDLSLFFNAQLADSRIVEAPFDSLDIESKSRSYALGVNYPITREIFSQFDLFMSFDSRRSESFLLGFPFSFSDGVEEGQAKVSVLRIGQSWRRSNQSLALLLRSTFSFGLDALGATKNQSGLADGQFIKWLWQAQLAKRLPWRGSKIIVRNELQWSDSPLLGLEKYSLGGHASVRGYRENFQTGDRGFFASVEWRVPLLSAAHKLDAALFVDGGALRNRMRDRENQNLSSIGVGLHWRGSSKVELDFQWAKTSSTPTSTSSNTLQDEGLHIGLRLKL
ncbi:MAG: BamA/TamA family outer membrane protein [Cellvibrionaceae bacterium]|nr:BamA/TamA family outer membrane protein [Cellvibrionaceae bacterium]